MRSILLLATVLTAPAALAAQANPLVGRWALEYPGGMQVENGVPTPIAATGVLTITSEGDSLVAVLVPGDASRPTVRMTAPGGAGTKTFVQRSEATMESGSGTETRTATSTWILTASGDALSGTVERAIEGLDLPLGGALPVRATRATSP
ncbi:MAG: hypothetical protein R3B35_12105 [Gemmatimonadales bacterium]